MKSVILCEGKDDLWFIAYYLHKTWGWAEDSKKEAWKNYKITARNHRQEVEYFNCKTDSTAIWSVNGKSGFERAVLTIFEKFVENYPQDPIDSIVMVRDRDDESIDSVLIEMQSWFSGGLHLKNKAPAAWEKEIDGQPVSINITPVIIPFSEEGAIETLLMEAVREQDTEGETIVRNAKKYIDSLLAEGQVGKTYLFHKRLILKAKYSSVIAVTNPDHSTGLFRDMVLACPWENSPYVQEHFSAIACAVSSQQ